MIGAEGDTGGGGERNEPLEVVHAQILGAGPDGRLIVEEIAWQVSDCHVVLRRRLRGWRVRKLGGAGRGSGLRMNSVPEAKSQRGEERREEWQPAR